MGRKAGTDRSVHAASQYGVLAREILRALGQSGQSRFFAVLKESGVKNEDIVRMLKHRFLIHSLHHAWVVVDIARYSLPSQISPEDEGKQLMVPSLRFGSWKDAERYFLALGAKASMIEETSAWLKQCSVAVLTIMSQPEE